MVIQPLSSSLQLLFQLLFAFRNGAPTLAALLADLRIELGAVLLAYSLATMLCLLRPRFGSSFVVCHRKSRLSYNSYTHIYPTYKAERHSNQNISLLPYRD